MHVDGAVIRITWMVTAFGGITMVVSRWKRRKKCWD